MPAPPAAPSIPPRSERPLDQLFTPPTPPLVPTPALLRIKHDAILPNRFRADV